MASLYKEPIVVRDPKTGKSVKQKSRKRLGRYRDASGRDCRVPLAVDKGAAPAMLNNLILRVELEKAGQLDPFKKHLKRPIAEHLQLPGSFHQTCLAAMAATWVSRVP